MKDLRLEIAAFNEEGRYKQATIGVAEYNTAKQAVIDSRWGNTQYMTTVQEETVARLLGVSACNFKCKVTRRYLSA